MVHRLHNLISVRRNIGAFTQIISIDAELVVNHGGLLPTSNHRPLVRIDRINQTIKDLLVLTNTFPLVHHLQLFNLLFSSRLVLAFLILNIVFNVSLINILYLLIQQPTPRGNRLLEIRLSPFPANFTLSQNGFIPALLTNILNTTQPLILYLLDHGLDPFPDQLVLGPIVAPLQ